MSIKKYTADEKHRIANLNNSALFDETLEAAGGDDYDGGFTQRGTVTYDLLREELERRLKDWLSQ